MNELIHISHYQCSYFSMRKVIEVQRHIILDETNNLPNNISILGKSYYTRWKFQRSTGDVYYFDKRAAVNLAIKEDLRIELSSIFVLVV